MRRHGHDGFSKTRCSFSSRPERQARSHPHAGSRQAESGARPSARHSECRRADAAVRRDVASHRAQDAAALRRQPAAASALPLQLRLRGRTRGGLAQGFTHGSDPDGVGLFAVGARQRGFHRLRLRMLGLLQRRRFNLRLRLLDGLCHRDIRRLRLGLADLLDRLVGLSFDDDGRGLGFFGASALAGTSAFATGSAFISSPPWPAAPPAGARRSANS